MMRVEVPVEIQSQPEMLPAAAEEPIPETQHAACVDFINWDEFGLKRRSE